MNRMEAIMERLLIRFLTRFPFRRRARPVAALLFYDVAPRELIRRVLGLRDRIRIRGRGLMGPQGVLVNDGSVLAAELLRSLPARPLGHMSFAAFDQEAASKFGFESLTPLQPRLLSRGPGNMPDGAASFFDVETPGVLPYTFKPATVGEACLRYADEATCTAHCF